MQAQLRQALDAALAERRAAPARQQMDVRTGQFSLYPRHGKNGEITGWQGRAELVLEGRDFARITAHGGAHPGHGHRQVGFGLSSREARAKVEREAQAQAIEPSRRGRPSWRRLSALPATACARWW